MKASIDNLPEKQQAEIAGVRTIAAKTLRDLVEAVCRARLAALQVEATTAR